MTGLTDLMTPCAIVDKARLETNLARMLGACAARDLAFRPHLKTLKSVDAARLLLAPAKARATVSTLLEAEIFAGAGFDDILYAVGITPQKLPRVGEICAKGVRLTVILDSVFMADQLVGFCQRNNRRIDAMIELDLDGHRSGVPLGDEARLCGIGARLHGAGLLRGVIAHAGASYGLSDPGALADMARDEAANAARAADTLRAAGFECDLVSIGSTPTALKGARDAGVNELRAGVFTFFDLVQTGVGVCSTDDIALSVLTSVISVDPLKNRLITDAGWMALSRDRGTAGQASDWGYGRVCLEDGTLLADILVADAQQEHGIVTAVDGSGALVPDLPIGARLRILPNHACATAAQHGRYHVLGVTGDIIETWERFSGW